jgi:AcrR family transcriptional regulator
MASTTTRDRILESARDLFLEHGAKAVSMRGVAARAGVTAMAIYRHFEGREALLRAVVAKGHATFLQYLQMALGGSTPWERLVRSGSAYLRFALENPRDYAVMFMEAAEEREPPRRRAPKWQDAATFRFLVDRIRECAAEGVLSVEDPEDAALTVWAQVHGLVSLYLAGKLALEERAFRRLYARSIERLVRGLAGPRAARRIGRAAAA